MTMRKFLLLTLPMALAACGSNQPTGDEADINVGRKEISSDAISPIGETLGTPMAERVAILGLLNKRNGQTRDVELKPGEAMIIGKVNIRLRACEATAPWENYPDQGAFVQLSILERPSGTNDAERWHQVFSGWLFKENPAANIVQHPTYDVWVKQCKMNFPGEEKAVERKAPSNAAQSADAAPPATPATPPTN